MSSAVRALAPEAASAASRPLRVLHLVDRLGVGGAETWLVELLRLWGSQGRVRMDVLATSGEEGVFDAEARALGANIFYLRYGRRDLATFARGFRQLLREGGYDAVHDHQDYASGWHFLLGGGALPAIRVTHVHNPAYQIRSNYGVTWRRRLTAAAGRRLVARHATHVVGTSSTALTDYGFDAPPFAAIPKAALHCGLDPARFRRDHSASAAVRAEFGWPADTSLILFAGRFDVSPDLGHAQNHKNSGFAVDVAIAAAEADPRVRFVFAGEPSCAAPTLLDRIVAARAADRIAFAGVRHDMGRLMSAADALLFPSRAEGLGMAAVEAQAAGLPVLASDDVPREAVVIPELVRFERVEAGVRTWRDALLSLVRAPRIDADVANRRVAASEFSIETSAARLERLYREGALA
ncbi:MAG TPA: glycosyltransferase [Caulobacteraceae bacterium]|nr:glycosyltransferase [Caulobacteraceae bacterium]